MENDMRKLLAAILMLSASAGAFAAVPGAAQAIADCCPDCPHQG
jgi:hypothetical protein